MKQISGIRIERKNRMQTYSKMEEDFSGAKVAILIKNKVLTILRDDFPNIPYPNMWDLPGGGRENEESAVECLQREVLEELGISISERNIVWSKFFEGSRNPEKLSFFAVAKLEEKALQRIQFGEEGQAYRLMDIDEFLTNERVILSLRNRLKEYLRENE